MNIHNRCRHEMGRIRNSVAIDVSIVCAFRAKCFHSSSVRSWCVSIDVVLDGVRCGLLASEIAAVRALLSAPRKVLGAGSQDSWWAVVHRVEVVAVFPFCV